MVKKFLGNLLSNTSSLEQIVLMDTFNEDDAVKQLKLDSSSINTINKDGLNLLDIALNKKRFKAASWLVRNGIDIKDTNKDKISSVRVAMEHGDIKLIDSFLDHKEFNINQVDKNGRSLLQDAVILGQEKVIDKLIEKKIDINIKDMHNRNVMFDAISYGDEKIIEKISNLNNIDMNLVDTDGNTILNDQNVLNNDTVATTLLKNGADPTICNNDGHNFLTKTALRGVAGEAILKVAIQYGCDLNAKVTNENSILMEVMYSFAKLSHSETKRRDDLKSVAKLLIKHGLDVDAINSNNETALFNIVRLGDVEGCAFILEQGININQISKTYETALSIAIVKGIVNLDIIVLLLQYGADPTIKNNHNQTILEILNNIILHVHDLKKLTNKKLLEQINPTGNYMIILREILSNKDFDYNYLDSLGETLFFLPFLFGDMKTCKLYLKYNLNINLPNQKGHNLFYEYVLKTFLNNMYDSTFRENLVFLMLNNSDINFTNKDGQTIYTKVATIPNCNLKLFRKLIEVTRYNYTAVDKLGRTIMHAAVMSNNLDLLKLLYGVERNIHNTADSYNILPITYAALFGFQDIVIEFLRKDAVITSGKPIVITAKNKFQHLLENVDNLTSDISDIDVLKNLKTFQEQVRIDISL